MRKIVWMVLATLWLAPAVSAQEVVDRIVARIGNDVITQSEIDQLGRYQLLIDGKDQASAARLHELAEQWIVTHEASLSGFTAPSSADIAKAFAQLAGRFGSAQAFTEQLKKLGLSESEVRQMLGRQLFLSRYLDYRFRPEVQVGEQEIEAYYRKTLVPRLREEGQAVPPLDRVEDRVREVLVERGISSRAAHWLDQLQAQWKVVVVEGSASP